MKIKDWNIEEMTGYKPKTSFYRDFSIADMFGIDAIKDTFKRAFNEWKDDTEYFTELAMALNWKMWEHDDNGNQKYIKLYYELWQQADDYVFKHWNEEQRSYYYRITD